MAHYQIEDVSFQYPNCSEKTLDHITITIEEGEFVLLCGPSGSGKTTLLRQLKREVRPEGNRSGSIYYRGIALDQLDERRSIEEIGMVFQDPDNQIVMNTVWQELTFGMENLGYSTAQMQRRVGELVQFFGMEEWLHLPIHELSGGQKQLVHLASVMTLRPRVLLLDEPTAQLDPIAAKEFIQLLSRINEEFSLTIIISEHRIEEVVPHATQLVMLNRGGIAYLGTPDQVMKQIWKDEDALFLPYLPSISQLYLGIEKVSDARAVPMSVKEGRRWLAGKQERRQAAGKSLSEAVKVDGQHLEPLLTCKELYFTYDKNAPLVLKRLSLSIQEGEFFALLGANGSGKSTLLQQIAGAHKPQRGDILYAGKSLLRKSTVERSRMIGYVAQNPMLYFTRDTVREQLMDRLRRLGEHSSIEKLNELAARFDIESIMDKHPFDISGGQQQKIALMLVLLADPKLLLLDEPTKGLDPISKHRLAELLEMIRAAGTTIVMVSHDIEFAASYASRCGLLFNGAMAAVDDTRSFLQSNYFYTTTIHRTVGDVLPEAITVKDVWEQWGN
ncbi:ABC transporter ATP-binding protein [Paenibacillus sp. NAIST15-1]|uniref:ABC transporter ATP-binding protein n=1 Tax=Paenibacillus sp. NAIST15-1 TaxID=1605994 RepID=UPI00086D98A3|nr:ATP-binding cassette domain-containing protein [Paenibacillus sp. NAIST15-1]GAV12702.1 ABC transporter ATP-binding protein [Paenibacillus sp. NAIST15-1]